MQFQIPQFIDIESKIVGPLTLRQFLYLAASGGISFILFFLIKTWLWFLITTFLAGIALALAFIKFNGQHLPKMVWLAFFYLWKPRVYSWQTEPTEKTITLPDIKERRKTLKEMLPDMPNVKKLWQDLLTSKTPLLKRERPWSKISSAQFQVFRKLTGQKEVAKRVDYR